MQTVYNHTSFTHNFRNEADAHKYASLCAAYANPTVVPLDNGTWGVRTD